MTANSNEAVWKRSSKCDNSRGNCVETTEYPGAIAVRDSKTPEGGVLVFTKAEWDAFVGGVKSDEFDY
jgi:hypothetical protein